ncbi:hypothetical protein ACP4OV_024478 [Aristida adscensionis]
MAHCGGSSQPEAGDGPVDMDIEFYGCAPCDTSFVSGDSAVGRTAWPALNAAIEAVAELKHELASDDLLGIVVPGAAYHVRISRQLILAEVVKHLRLSVYSHGVVRDRQGELTLWIKLELPSIYAMEDCKEMTFYGDPCDNTTDAVESACKEVLKFLKKKGCAKVKDESWEELVDTRERLAASKLFGETMHKMVSQVKTEHKATKYSLARLTVDAKHMCKNYGNIMPIKVYGLEFSESSPQLVTALYAGPTPPTMPMESLAWDMVILINKMGAIAFREA